MKQPSVYLKMRVLGALDTVEGRTRHQRVLNVAAMTFLDEEGNPRRFTWRTIQTWYYRYKNHGITGMTHQPRKDKGQVRKATRLPALRRNARHRQPQEQPRPLLLVPEKHQQHRPAVLARLRLRLRRRLAPTLAERIRGQAETGSCAAGPKVTPQADARRAAQTRRAGLLQIAQQFGKRAFRRPKSIRR